MIIIITSRTAYRIEYGVGVFQIKQRCADRGRED